MVLKSKNDSKIEFYRNGFLATLGSTRLSRKDKIRNTIIKQKMNGTMSLLDDINTKKLKRCGRVQRMEEGRLPKQAMKWNPPGRRT